ALAVASERAARWIGLVIGEPRLPQRGRVQHADVQRRVVQHGRAVRDGGTVVGCGALKRLDARHAEVKSMRTLAARKRSGIASMMLEHIITEARRMGFTRLSLETGSAEF